MTERIQKWRMILGKKADPAGTVSLEQEEEALDNTVEALYDSERQGGLGASSPNVNRWLGDIRRYFPKPVVRILQRDALERLGLKKMLLEPELLEGLEPDVELVSTLLSLKKVIPEKTRETARMLVGRLVRRLEEKLRGPMRQAVEGAINRSFRNRRPSYQEIDWHKTIRANLKHYQVEYRSIIPEQLIGHGRKSRKLKQIFLLVDQSASMASSLVYAGIMGSILGSLRSVKTYFIVFDSQVADLSGLLDDPVELLFGTQLGGGTDIGKALSHVQRMISSPGDSILVLISDLYEGGTPGVLLKRAGEIKNSGVNFISLLALDDAGTPAYDKQMAERLAQLDIPVFGCTPNEFPDIMSRAICNYSLSTAGRSAPSVDNFPG